MKKEKRYVSACPNCGSTEIGTDFKDAVKIRFGAPLMSRCNSCGYRAYTFPEIIESKLEYFREHLKKIRGMNL